MITTAPKTLQTVMVGNIECATVDAIIEAFSDLKVKQSQIGRLIRNGELASRRLGASYVVTVESLTRWLESGRFKARVNGPHRRRTSTG